jgi:hypothetical protein
MELCIWSHRAGPVPRPRQPMMLGRGRCALGAHSARSPLRGATSARSVAWSSTAQRGTNDNDVDGNSIPMAQATRGYTNTSMEMAGSGFSPKQRSERRKFDGDEDRCNTLIFKKNKIL